MSTHYQTLGLDEQATADDIRRAYRRLVLLTHPDRTPDPAAHAQYLAINEAYEVLGNARRRAGYDALLWVRRHPPAPAVPAGTAVARSGRPAPVRLRTVSLQERYAAQYALLLRWMRPFMLTGVLLGASLGLDWLLAATHPEQVQALNAGVYYVGGRYPEPHVYYSHQTARGSFDSDSAVAVGETLLVRRTPLWRKALLVHRLTSARPIETDTIYSGLTWLVPLALSLLAGLTLWPSLNPDYRLGFGLVGFALLGVTIYELLHH